MEKSFNLKKMFLLFGFILFSFLLQLVKAKPSIESIQTYIPLLIFSLSILFIFDKKIRLHTLIPGIFLLTFGIRQNIAFSYTLDELSIILFIFSFISFKYSILLFILCCVLNIKLLVFFPLYLYFGEIPGKAHFKKIIDYTFIISLLCFAIQAIIFSNDHLFGRLYDFFDPRFKAMYIFFILGFSLFPWRLDSKKNHKSFERFKYLGFGIILFSFFNFSSLSNESSLLLFFGGLHFVVMDYFNSVKNSFTALLSFIAYLFFCGIY